MLPKTSIQLFTLREQLATDFKGTLQELANIGFPCVQPAGFYGHKPAEVAKLLRELGMTAPTTHCKLPIGDAKNEIIETALELGHRYLITGVPPNGKEDMNSADAVKATAEQYCKAAENAAKHDLQIGYHNHDWDLAEFDGQRAYHIFLAHTPETILWEADLFWVARAGIDPVGFLQEIGIRGKALHFKDGHIVDRNIDPPFLPAGQGDVDLLAAAKSAEHAESIAVELDRFDGDMLNAVAQSFQYLTENKISTATSS